MPEQGDNAFFSPLEGRGLFSRLRLELRGLKEWSPRSSFEQLRASFSPDAEEDRLPFRLARAVRDFARDLKARPRETLVASFAPDPTRAPRPGAWRKILLASAAGHVALVALLLFSGVLAPVFLVKHASPEKDYEVTMLAPVERLPRAPWLPPPPEAFDPFAAQQEAAVVQTPATIPQTPPAPSAATIRPPRAPRGRGQTTAPNATETTLDPAAPADNSGDGNTQPDSSGGATPTPGAPRRNPATAGRNATANAATQPTPANSATGGAAADTPAAIQQRLRELIGRTYADYRRPAAPAPQPQPTATNTTAVVEFKINPEGQLSDVKLVAPSNSPAIDAALQEALGALGRLRSFQSLAKLSTQNSLRLTLDDASAQVVVSCTAANPEMADAMTPVLTVVVREIANSLGGPDLLTRLGDKIKVTVEGNRADAVLGLTNEEAAELIGAHFAPAPSPTPAKAGRK